MSSPHLQLSASSRTAVKCDFEEFDCPQTFSRPHDMLRHKKERHEEPKKCPWCEYSARRDQRVLDHIDEIHRPRYQRHRSGEAISRSHPSDGIGANSRPAQRQGLYPRAPYLGRRSFLQEPDSTAGAYPSCDSEMYTQQDPSTSQVYLIASPESQGGAAGSLVTATADANRVVVPCPRCGHLPASALPMDEQPQAMRVPHGQMSASVLTGMNNDAPSLAASQNQYTSPEVRYAFGSQPTFASTPMNCNYNLEISANPTTAFSSMPWFLSSLPAPQTVLDPWRTPYQSAPQDFDVFHHEAPQSSQNYTTTTTPLEQNQNHEGNLVQEASIKQGPPGH